MNTTLDSTMIPLELDRRDGDGISVSLLWHKAGNMISVAVYDERTSEEFALLVSPDRALDAFRHPFAYAAREGILQEHGAREPAYA